MDCEDELAERLAVHELLVRGRLYTKRARDRVLYLGALFGFEQPRRHSGKEAIIPTAFCAFSFMPLPLSQPSELVGLAVLNDIAMDGNSLTSSIPSELGQLTAMGAGISLASNQLTGSIPSEFGALTDLTLLQIGTNYLTGSLPSQLAGMLSIDASFRLGENSISGSVPTQIGVAFQLMTGAFELLKNSFTSVTPLAPHLLSCPISPVRHDVQCRHNASLAALSVALVLSPCPLTGVRCPRSWAFFRTRLS